MASGSLNSNVFTFYMSDNPFSELDSSELTFGYIDHERYIGELEYHPVLQNNLKYDFWAIGLDEILLNGVSLNIGSKNPCTMTPDSGTTYMTMPSWAREIFVAATFPDDTPCGNDLSVFGDITFVINTKHYTLPAHHWVRRKTDHDPKNALGGLCENNFRA